MHTSSASDNSGAQLTQVAWFREGARATAEKPDQISKTLSSP